MFLVGVEFRTDLLRDRAPSAVAVSVAGMAVPFLLGGVIALAVYADGMMFRPTVTPAQAFLYLWRGDVDHGLPHARPDRPGARARRDSR